MSNCWYALQVKPRFENHVTTQLQAKGFEVFLPTYISRRKWSDRIKCLSLPLFPGYVFCRFDLQARLPVVVTPGVTAVLGTGRVAQPVGESEVYAIQHVTSSGFPAQPFPYLATGEKVRVESGPLEGLVGIIVRTKGADRIVVSISLLMRSVCVELDRGSVVRLRESDYKNINGGDLKTTLLNEFEVLSIPSKHIG